jgi:hypothetical protein
MPPLEEPDRIDGVALALVFILTLLASAACVAVALWLLVANTPAHAEGSSSAPRTMPSTVSSVQTGLFARAAGASSTNAEAARLRTYGWVDRERGLVHIPVERAMDLYIAQARRSSSSQPAPDPKRAGSAESGP